MRVLNKQGRYEYRDPVFNQIDYYPLPWPKQALDALGEKHVEFKIALSYFIEPSRRSCVACRVLQATFT